jgi:hypothetical protein
MTQVWEAASEKLFFLTNVMERHLCLRILGCEVMPPTLQITYVASIEAKQLNFTY